MTVCSPKPATYWHRLVQHLTASTGPGFAGNEQGGRQPHFPGYCESYRLLLPRRIIPCPADRLSAEALNIAAPAMLRHGAVMPGFMKLALSRQKFMIPKVSMVRNRIVSGYAPITALAADDESPKKVA
jgi:hypothetical protein